MKVNNINYAPIYFRGSTSVSHSYNSQTNAIGVCCLETHFMRDLYSLEYTSNYIKNNFPNGTNIANYACSRGYEAYSLATLLKDSNADKKYKITGYDIVPEAIQDAKTAIFNIGESSNLNEDYLIRDYLVRTPLQKQIKTLFDECFEPIPDKWRHFNVQDHRYRHKAQRVNPQGQNIDLTIQRLEYLHLPSERNDDRGHYYIPRKDAFNGVIDFKIGDIMDVDKDLAAQKCGVITFKNALYHLIGRDTEIAKLNLSNAQILFKKINSALEQNGLFLLGSLNIDHCFNSKVPEKDIDSRYQNNKLISVYDKSPIHELLRESGFEPVFYDRFKSSNSKNGLFSGPHLPAIWKKVKNVI